MKRVFVIGGTTEGRELTRALRDAGYDVISSVLTDHGARMADDAGVRAGGLDATGLAELARGCMAVIDASHPFARNVSAEARKAAEISGVPYLRLEREAARLPEHAIVCEDAAGAARAAADNANGGAVLLTVGSRTLSTYVAACRQAGLRCIARVLPVPDALEACSAAGLGPEDVIAMQGPTDAALDAALLRNLGATVLVTKDSGRTGGVEAKAEAADRTGATLVVVRRPEAPDGALSSPEQVVAALAALGEGGASTQLLHSLASPPSAAAEARSATPSTLLSEGPSSSKKRTRLLHVYFGEGKGKTTAAVGLAFRARGAGFDVAFVQFVKGGRESSELALLREAGVHVVRPAIASTGLLRGTVTPEDRTAAAAAVDEARCALAGDFGLVVLDEVLAAVRGGLISEEDLLGLVDGRAAHVEVVCTGRVAPAALLERADYATEMRAVKHPYADGVPAREGIEY